MKGQSFLRDIKYSNWTHNYETWVCLNQNPCLIGISTSYHHACLIFNIWTKKFPELETCIKRDEFNMPWIKIIKKKLSN